MDASADLEIKDDEQYETDVLLAYLLNPYTIMSCAGQTTTVLSNMTTAVAILFTIKGWYYDYNQLFCVILFLLSNIKFWAGYRVLAGIFLAISTYQSLYPISLILPAVICIYNKEVARKGKEKVTWLSSTVKTLVAFAVPLIGIILMSRFIARDWTFIDRTYGFM